MELSYKERLNFIFQLKILEKLYPDESPSYQQLRIAFENGYTAQYDWFFDYISKDELSKEDCKLVWGILDMYDHIIHSYTALKDKEGLTDDLVKFPGFDGNNESEFMAYTRYITGNLNRFGGVIRLHQIDYNSHIEKLDAYKRMLSKFKAIPVPTVNIMTAQQIRNILN